MRRDDQAAEVDLNRVKQRVSERGGPKGKMTRGRDSAAHHRTQASRIGEELYPTISRLLMSHLRRHIQSATGESELFLPESREFLLVFLRTRVDFFATDDVLYLETSLRATGPVLKLSKLNREKLQTIDEKLTLEAEVKLKLKE